jgi:hypothetical protein
MKICPRLVHVVGAAVLGAACLSLPAAANVTYSYVGPSFTLCVGPYVGSCSDNSVSGSFTTTLSPVELENLDDYSLSPAEISSFSFTGGFGLMFDNTSNLHGTTFQITTDGAGAITSWVIGMYQYTPMGFPYGAYIETLNRAGPQIVDDSFKCLTYNPNGFCEDRLIGFSDQFQDGTPGIWTSSTVPEPATLALLGISLAGLGFARRKQ